MRRSRSDRFRLRWLSICIPALGLMSCPREHTEGTVPVALAPRAALALPKVSIDDALATSSRPPPLLVALTASTTIDKDSKAIIAVAPADWGSLATVDPSRGNAIATLEIATRLRAATLCHWSPDRTVNSAQQNIDLTDLTGCAPPDAEEPPPTAVDDLHVSATGGFGRRLNLPVHQTGWGPRLLDTAPYPTRLADIVGVVAGRVLSPKTRVLVLASPRLEARALILVIGETRGAIAVLHAGHVAALRVQFIAASPPPLSVDEVPWVELRIPSPGHFELEAVPSQSVALAGLDGLKASLSSLRDAHKLDPWNPIDILVGRDVDVQQLVDAIVAVEQAGGHAIGLGDMPDPTELALRGHPIHAFFVQSIAVNGDADRLPVLRVLNAQGLSGCYEKALAINSTLEGSIEATFSLDRTGNVTTSTAKGVDDTLASCVATLIQRARYPTHGRATVTIRISAAPDRRYPTSKH